MSVIVKVGVDVIEVARIKDNIIKKGNTFLDRVFTAREIEYCESRKAHKFESYAVRFAVKEAIFKAISEVLDSKYEIEWKNIEVLNGANGRPYVNLECEFFKDKRFCRLKQMDISLSHVADVAMAAVVVEFLDEEGN